MSEVKNLCFPVSQQLNYIHTLEKELPFLRAKVGISQSELSNFIGISRQTYSSIESGRREMSWNTYLSLLFFFDYHVATHHILRTLNLLPVEFISAINNGEFDTNLSHNAIAGIPETVTQKLDEQALHTIRTVVMIEYARCANISGDEVVKAFGGTTVHRTLSELEVQTQNAIQRIKKGKNQL